jgi:prepilin-type N-terminal cleavage/methylation domain-containing protein
MKNLFPQIPKSAGRITADSVPTDWNAAGFTLAEMMISLVILSAVGLGAYSVIMGVTSSQKKLEQALERGFNSFAYKPRNTPLQPLRIGFQNKLGWMRIPSVHALIDPTQEQLNWLRKGTPTDLRSLKIFGDGINRHMAVSIVSDDARLEDPVWVKCEGDQDIRVECLTFQNGQASVVVTIGARAQQLAALRLRAAWPSLPEKHPYKYSPEYSLAIPLARDCEMQTEIPKMPKFLLHNSVHRVEGPTNASGCIPKFQIYQCLNGQIKIDERERYCP